MLFRLLALFLQGFYVTVQKQEIIIVLLWLLTEVINILTLPEAWTCRCILSSVWFDSDARLHGLQPSGTWAFSLCILVLYGELILSSFLNKISPRRPSKTSTVSINPPLTSNGLEVNNPPGGGGLIEDFWHFESRISPPCSLKIPNRGLQIHCTKKSRIPKNPFGDPLRSTI